MLVGHTSATHSSPMEKPHNQIAINADHSDIVKFATEYDPDYVTVASRIRTLVRDGPDIVGARFGLPQRELGKVA